ncbi:MAG: histidine phosphatase family protein [Christensenellales bacterium]
MKIIYIHHALRAVGNPPTQNDGIQPLGIKDAETTAELLKGVSDKSKSTFRAIYTSPYYRCSETAKLINKYINLPIYEEPRFNEFNKVFEVIQGDKSITKTETWSECQTRIRNAIKDIVDKYNNNDTVICVTSGVNITAFIGLAYKIPVSENMPFPWVPSCSPIGFEIDKSMF